MGMSVDVCQIRRLLVRCLISLLLSFFFLTYFLCWIFLFKKDLLQFYIKKMNAYILDISIASSHHYF